MVREKTFNSRRASLILFLFLFVMYAIVYMTKSIFSSAMASIVEEGFMTKSQTGLINASFWFVYAVFQFFGGFAVDKFSPKKMIMIGMAGAIVSNAVIYLSVVHLSRPYPVIIAAWMFNAIAQFGLWPGVFKIMSTQIIPELRGTATFWILFSGTFGAGISMLVASFVKHWRHNFIVSIIGLSATLVIYALIDSFIVDTSIPDEGINETRDVPEKAKMTPLLISSGLTVMLVVCMLRGAVDNGIRMMTPVMLMESYEGLPASISTRMSTILIVFSVFGTLVAGWVHSKITTFEPKAQIALFTLSLLPLSAVCFLGRVHYVVILAALCITTVLLQGVSPFTQSFISLRFEKYGRIGTVAGIVNAAASVGNILASYVFAKMAEIMPWRWVAVSWIAVVALCIILCISVYRRWKRFIIN